MHLLFETDVVLFVISLAITGKYTEIETRLLPCIVGCVVGVFFYFIGKMALRYGMKERDFPMKEKALCAGCAETHMEIVTS